MVSGVEQDVHGQVDGLLGTGEAEHVIGLHVLVRASDLLPQRGQAPRLGVAEREGLPAPPAVVVRGSRSSDRGIVSASEAVRW